MTYYAINSRGELCEIEERHLALAKERKVKILCKKSEATAERLKKAFAEPDEATAEIIRRLEEKGRLAKENDSDE